MRVRPFEDGDADVLVAIFHAAVHQLGVDHYDAEQRRAWAPDAPDVAAWAARFAGMRTLVAEEDGVACGFITFDDGGYVDLLYVAPQAARRGVASQLYATAEADMRARGAARVTTHASQVARPFFERQGLVVTETEDVARGAVVMRRFAMSRDLGPDVAAWLPPQTPPTHTPLSDGRVLAWRAWGHEGGRPVLFCPGAATTSLLGFGADVVTALDVRVIAIDRPGLGASSAHADKSLASWVEDVAALVGATGCARPHAVGFSQGSVFALALAAAGVVHGVAVVSGQDELAHPDVLPALPTEIANLVGAAADDPRAFEMQMQAWADPASMWKLVVDTSGDSDRAIFTSPPFAARYRAALDEALASTTAGYARDTSLAMRRWTFDLGAIRCPVTLWYGALDTSPVHALDHGAGLNRRIPHAHREVDPTAGSAILWTRAHDILHDLVS